MHLRKSIITGAVVVAFALLPATAANASTGSSDPAPNSTRVTTPMVVHGYDAQVAAANGYKIVTNADAAQESIPVTAAAVAQSKQADQRRAGVQAQSAATPAVVGNCGSSWVSGVKQAHDTVAFSTGFLVYLAATHYTWTVYATGAITGNHLSSTGGGPASGTRSWTGAIPSVIGPGIGGVPFACGSASVVLVDGTVCYSVGPTFLFN